MKKKMQWISSCCVDHAEHQKKELKNKERGESMRRVAWMNVLLNSCAASFKMIAGYLGHSHALVADGVHSLADVVFDVIALMTVRYSNRTADAQYPYGHRRIETLVSIFFSVLLIWVGLEILLDAWHESHHHGDDVLPLSVTLWVAMASVLLNEFLYRMTIRMGEKTNSSMLIAHAWHRRGDAWASLAVLLGIAGSLWFGIETLDLIASGLVALLIAKMGLVLGFRGLKELVDVGVDGPILDQITQIIQSVEGVLALHCLRTRRMGGDILVDAHILVASRISVSEGHWISHHIRQKLLEQIQNFADITLHIDPEDDEHHVWDYRLMPSREDIHTALQPILGDRLLQLQLHYLEGSLEVELYVTSCVTAEILLQVQQNLIEQWKVRHVQCWQSINF